MNRIILAASVCLALAACDRDAQVASRNLSYQADNFQIARRIVFYNGITNEYILEVRGMCSLGTGSETHSLAVTCKVNGEYKKHFLGLSHNVTWFAEQIDSANVSTQRYSVSFKPSTIIPAIELR